MNLDIVVLAAGKGTRMRSNMAKVLHKLSGRSLITHVMSTAAQLSPRHIAVVVGHQAQDVMTHLGEGPVWVEQAEQLGTGHAVKLAMKSLASDGVTLILYGDVPLVSLDALKRCVSAANAGEVGLITANFSDPAELGRIIRDENGNITAITEYKDASEAERQICEINSGIMAVPSQKLNEWLARIEPNNTQGEYYLTDIIAMAAGEGVSIRGVLTTSPEEVTGVNDRAQLAELERVNQRWLAERLMRNGVTIADPTRLDIRGELKTGQDCFIDINAVFEGNVTIGDDVTIGPGVVIKNSQLGNGVQVHAHTVIEGASIANDCSVGPFARIRPGTRMDDGVKIGNFVETKQTHLGAGSKAGHLTYLGDATLGENCNVGAGTVTCNYDGIDKHSTDIGNNVFVGTNSTLIAPIQIEDNAFIAAGTTVTTKVSSGDLAVGRAKQRNISGWVRPGKRSKSKRN